MRAFDPTPSSSHSAFVSLVLSLSLEFWHGILAFKDGLSPQANQIRCAALLFPACTVSLSFELPGASQACKYDE